MSWLFSRALVEAYSQDISLGGAPSAPSNETPTPLAYCAPDKMTDFSRLSRFGTTFAPLTGELGEAVLTWFLEVSHAKTSAQQERAPESRENEADSGEKWLASFAKFDRASSSWKTLQCSLVEDLESFSGTWPSSGMMRGGACWERITPGLHTGEIEFGLWLPTPTARPYGTRNNGHRPDGSTYKTAGSPSLATMARRGTWPTPTATANMLAPSMQKWPCMASQVGGSLNPTWVEWLMGWPLGWTALEPLETDKFRQWLHSHGSY